jgi:hypothetical protein
VDVPPPAGLAHLNAERCAFAGGVALGVARQAPAAVTAVSHHQCLRFAALRLVAVLTLDRGAAKGWRRIG